MCGIWALLGENFADGRTDTCVKTLEARGPEGTHIVALHGATFGFTRLAINGLNPLGMQPMKRGDIWWMCNGEIYNWKELAEEYGLESKSGSDCEVLGPLFEKIVAPGEDAAKFFRMLDGVFAIAILDCRGGQRSLVLGRDPYGVRPLFVGYEKGGVRVVASEVKAILAYSTNVRPFPQGTCETYDLDHGPLYRTAYHTIPWLKNPMYTSVDMACLALRTALGVAVKKRMLTERPVAALLSGGIDSSLIASLVAKELRVAGAPPLKTFSIGMSGSQDLFYAKKVAKWIGSDHHEIVLDAKEFLDAIPKVIHDIESFDTTTVRASVGNWLVAREVAKRSDCKVVFNGDGSDEVFGSYLYFYGAPTRAAYEEEVTRLLSEISMFDVLRSDRCISSHGLEPRTPFLDKQFVAVARSIPTDLLRPSKGTQVEKWILRKAFDDGETLPYDVLWRRKEAFSDGVSSSEKSWYQMAQERAETLVPEDWASKVDDVLPATTAEMFLYRYYFNLSHGKEVSGKLFPHFWMPRWSPGVTDPSARALQNY